MEPTSSTRKSPRFVPKSPVTVVLSSDGQPLVYGVLVNISEGGMCFKSDVVPRDLGREYVLSFYQGEYYQERGRVVWADAEEGSSSIGVKFLGIDDTTRHKLTSNFRSGAFAPV